MLEFETKVAGFIRSEGLLGPAEKILLAASGGADSTALMYAMCELKSKGMLNVELVCCHINHGLRGPDADLDEECVRTAAEQLHLPIRTDRVDVRGYAREHKLSIETAGRKLRMKALLRIAGANGCSCITTGHQKNDNAETVVQRMLRGTGFRGLAGIWPVRTFGGGIRFVRPLLCVTRDEIIDYLRARNLGWRVDHTNCDCTYRRNFIRHRLLPALQRDCTGSIVQQLSELGQSAFKFHSLVCNCAERAWAQSAECDNAEAVLDVERFSSQHPAVKVELVRRGLAAIGSGEGDLTQRHYETVLQLAEQNTGGGQIALPEGFVVRREYGKLIVGRSAQGAKTFGRTAKVAELKVPGQTRFEAYSVEASILEGDGKALEAFKAAKDGLSEWFDLKKVCLPLLVRCRAAGDRFWPLGQTGEKKVGKFLTTAKIPLGMRKRILIVADREKIIWVWPIRMSEQAKVDGGTRKILQLRITDKHSLNRQKQECRE